MKSEKMQQIILLKMLSEMVPVAFGAVTTKTNLEKFEKT